MKKIILTPETHPLTWRIRKDKQPIWLSEYHNKNGYVGAKKALSDMTADEVIKIVKNSGLKGRGGAGFPTWLKWSALSSVEHENIKTHYLICNADEMEPGTYKDRMLMEQLPHLLIEGMLISAFAINAYRGYIFLRDEYVQAKYCLRRAIVEANDAGLLGTNIFDTEFSFNIFVHTGAGRYICGEETALLNALEGRRANPRSKPPFPAMVGVWGKPTCVNNVETLCNIPALITNGEIWYKNLSKSKDTGTKLMGFSGRVRNPGVWELPFGITAREVLEEYAGGMCDNLKLKAWQPGGAGTEFLTEKHLDVAMDFENINRSGSRLGTALAIAVDNNISMISLVRNLEEFFSRESCGWCTPCRDGLPWSVKILRALECKEGQSGDIEMLEQLCYFLGPGKTFCAHALGAAGPLQSAIKYFREEFERGIKRISK